MSFRPTAEEVHKATGKPLENIKLYLPGIYFAMDEAQIISIPAVIATLATVAVEGPFKPIDEYGGPKYFAKYDGRTDLGNVQPGDGARFHGRGFVQLTGRLNYTKYGKALGVDLVADPEKANDPVIAARVLCKYMRDHGCDVWAARGHWEKVRKLVNGGTNGLPHFLECVWNLLDVAYRR